MFLPTDHTERFSQYCSQFENNGQTLYHLNPNIVQGLRTGALSLSDFETLLIEQNAAQDNIFVSKQTNLEDEGFPTGVAFIRNAIHAKPLDKRISPDAPLIEASNMLLRTLNTTRGIEHIIHKRIESSVYGTSHYFEKLNEIHTIFSNLTGSTIKLTLDNPTNSSSDLHSILKDIQALEKGFNSFLVGILNELHLDRGLHTRDEYEKLLTNYRYLASTLEPAPGMQTIQYDEKNQITHVDTAIPITYKTDKQKQQFQQLKNIYIPGEDNPKNYQSSKPLAFQELFAGFSDLIINDHRRLPGQTRKNIADSVKNGYVTHKALIKNDETCPFAEKSDIRFATLSYVGKGQTENENTDSAFENIKQLQNALDISKVENKKINLVILNTNSPHEDQDKIIKYTKNAVKKLHSNSVKFTYCPTNIEGTFRKPNFSEFIDKNATNTRSPFRKKRRLKQIVNGLMTSLERALPAVGCASGSDRTSTLLLAFSQTWTHQQYKNKNISISSREIEDLDAKSCHYTNLARLETPGSPGLKEDSKVNDFFNKETDNFLYTKSSKTNKKAPVRTKHIKLKYTVKLNGTQFDFIGDNRDNIEKMAISHVLSFLSYELSELFNYNRNRTTQLKSLIYKTQIKNTKLTQERITVCNKVYNEISGIINKKDSYNNLYDLRNDLLKSVETAREENNRLSQTYERKITFWKNIEIKRDGLGELDKLLSEMELLFKYLDVQQVRMIDNLSEYSRLLM